MKATTFCFDNATKYDAGPKRDSVTGGSAAGHSALLAGMAPGKIRAAINLYGITDVEAQLHGANRRKYTLWWFPQGPERTALAPQRLSPRTYVRKEVPPVRTLPGDAAGMIPGPKGIHAFPRGTQDQLYPTIFEFLKKHGVME